MATAKPFQIEEYGEKLKRVMQAFLDSYDGNRSIEILEGNRDVMASIFGKNWQPNRRVRDLEPLKEKVREVQDTMFCGPNHIFCVSVMPLESDNGAFDYCVPTKSGCEWTFELPLKKKFEVRVRTLLTGSTAPLCLWRRDMKYTADGNKIDMGETAQLVGMPKSKQFVLKFDEPVTLTNSLCLAGDLETEMLCLKDRSGSVILRMNFHTVGSTHILPPTAAMSDAEVILQLRSTIEIFREQVRADLRAIEALNRETSQLRTGNDDLRNNVRFLEGKIKNLEDMRDLLEDKNTRLTHSMKHSQDAYIHNIKNMEEAYSELQSENKELKNDIAELKANFKEKQQQWSDWWEMSAQMGGHTQLRCLLAKLA